MRRLRRRQLLVVGLLAASLLPVMAWPASACSCALGSPAEMIDGHDAAFLGSVAGVRSAGMNRHIWTFDVQRWVKGDLGPTVEVATASSGASCGFELRHGEEAAIFLTVEADKVEGGLCSTLDADAVRAHLDPQRVRAGTATTVVSGGDGAGAHLWLFDDRGRLVGSADDPRGDWLMDFGLCPGGRRAVELWERKVVIRDLATQRGLRALRVPANVGRVWCRDANATAVLVARQDHATGDWGSIARLDALHRPLVSGDFVEVDVVGRHLLATVGRDDTQLRRLSLRTDRVSLLHQAADDSGAELNVPPGIEGFAVNPAGDRVAFEVTRYPEGGQPSSEVFVRDISDGALLTTAWFNFEGSAVQWLDDQRLVFTNDDDPPVVLDADDLDVLAELPAEAGWATVAGADGALIGMDGPRLSSVVPATGSVSVLATVPAQYTGWLERLPRPLRVEQASRRHRGSRDGVTQASTTSPDPTDLGARGFDEGRQPPARFALGLSLAGVLAAMCFGAVRRRPRRR
ncbi:MAG: hypothetical protein M3425_07695 [Actinomycetota bacterium]|nr:hypothetical protein [Euzebyales bacterium]MDQ3342935.1 hypothetical protein [Actinomycetota bacterium]MDQ3529816.1 hypothetical protein [Actinomycetota bacterium]